MNRIVHKDFTATDYTGDETLRSGSIFIEDSIAQDELSVDTLESTLDFALLAPTIFQPKDAEAMLDANDKLFGVMPRFKVIVTTPADFAYGDIVYYYYNDILKGKFYMESIDRVGETLYSISCTSAIGLLTGATHYGGVYTGQAFSTVVADIIGNAVPYSIGSVSISNIKIYGYLPIDTRRNNLQQLLFATGVSLSKDDNGDINFVSLSSAITDIPDDKVYLGGTVSLNTPITKATIIEHAYYASDTTEEAVLFQEAVNSSTIVTPKGQTVQGALITFQDGPFHSLRAVDTKILESGENYAVLSGSAGCVLYGKPYIHTTRQVVRTNDASAGRAVSIDLKDNEVTVDGATLVNQLNSENVADRVYSYYRNAQSTSASIVVDGQKPGDRITLSDTFGNPVTGFIKNMDINMSWVLRGDLEIISGYTPITPGNNYSKVEILTTRQNWTVPDNVYRIMLVLIGGGDGGYSGAPGEDGNFGEDEPGKGGLGGQGGEGGKVLILTIPVIPGDIYSFVPGSPGSGGVCDGVNSIAGGKGGPTTFRNYSSADGTATSLGYKEILGGQVYALPGGPGRDGGNGRKSNDPAERLPLDPESGRYYPGRDGTTDEFASTIANGGGGGGPAFWERKDTASNPGNGEDGKDGKIDNPNTEQSVARGGDGGDGAAGGPAPVLKNYTVAPTLSGTIWTQLGSGRGGYGGHGGGAGGNGGRASGGAINNSGEPGAGGLGGKGGDGFSGCAIIYLP